MLAIHFRQVITSEFFHSVHFRQVVTSGEAAEGLNMVVGLTWVLGEDIVSYCDGEVNIVDVDMY